MPTGLQANNLGPLGFGQPNMNRAQPPGPGYGMPQRPIAPGQEPQPKAPPGGAGRAPQGPPPPSMGVPGGLYRSPLGQDAMRAKPEQFPADAVYQRVQKAILNPGPPRPMAPPPPMPPMPLTPPSPMAPPPMPGGNDFASAMQFMQQQLGGGIF
jgi:hypothetical protein